MLVKSVVSSIVFFLTAYHVLGQLDQTAELDKVKRKVVFIIVDGISADMLENTKTPYLDSIAIRGGYSRAYVGGLKNGYSQTPTISAVGYNSLLTGTWVNKHQVYGNDIKEPNYNYPTLFRIVKDNDEQKKTAIFSTWQDNRTKLVGKNLKETGYLKVDYAFDGFELDTLNFPHDEEHMYIKNIDEHVAMEAARYIRAEGPDLSWVYLQFTDDIGHKYGDGPQLKEAIAFEDLLVGTIWRSVLAREQNYQEEWLLLVTTDHGRTQADGKGHGGQSDRERSTWIVTNSGDTNAYFREQTPAIVDIMPTVLRFMKLPVADEIAYEIDGVPFIGRTDVFDLKAKRQGRHILVSWQSINKPKGKAKILLTTTNNFKTGKEDSYKFMGEVLLTNNHLKLRNIPHADVIKIVLQSEHNTLNTWVLEKE